MILMKKKLMVALAVGALIAPMMAQTDVGNAESGRHEPPAWILSCCKA